MTDKHVQCSYCPRKRCFVGDLSQAPDFCPSHLHSEELDTALSSLHEPENQEMARDVARTWKDYGKLTRVEETILYARLRGHKRLGLAFCVGLSPLIHSMPIHLGQLSTCPSPCIFRGNLYSSVIGRKPPQITLDESKYPLLPVSAGTATMPTTLLSFLHNTSTLTSSLLIAFSFA